jgi:hypothetical protein
LFVCFFYFFLSFHVRLTSLNLLPMPFARVNRVETTRNMFCCVVFVFDSHSDSPWRKSPAAGMNHQETTLLFDYFPLAQL